MRKKIITLLHWKKIYRRLAIWNSKTRIIYKYKKYDWIISMKIYTRQKHELSDSLVCWLFRFSAAGWILALFETFGTKKGFEFLSLSANVMKIASTWSCRVSSLADVSNRGISCMSANDWATDVLTLFLNLVFRYDIFD